jgi:hypothetical protein
MNALLEEMRRGMEELQLGLDGALNMSDRMEALARGIAANAVPDAWMACMSTRIQEVGCIRWRLTWALLWALFYRIQLHVHLDISCAPASSLQNPPLSTPSPSTKHQKRCCPWRRGTLTS